MISKQKYILISVGLQKFVSTISFDELSKMTHLEKMHMDQLSFVFAQTNKIE